MKKLVTMIGVAFMLMLVIGIAVGMNLPKPANEKETLSCNEIIDYFVETQYGDGYEYELKSVTHTGDTTRVNVHVHKDGVFAGSSTFSLNRYADEMLNARNG